ncbi:MAG: hypothetical protein ACRD10_14440, partial [Terriglobia bacterium]
YFNEFVVQTPGNARKLLAALEEEKILGGVELERFYPELKDHVLVCATETAGKQSIDRMAAVYRRVGAKLAKAARKGDRQSAEVASNP